MGQVMMSSLPPKRRRLRAGGVSKHGTSFARIIHLWLTGMSNFRLLKCFALTPNAVSFLGVRMGPPAVAAVGSMQRLRMSAHANFVALHMTLASSAMQSAPKAGVGRSGRSHF